MLRTWISGGVSAVAAVVFLVGAPDAARAWWPCRCNNGIYYTGGNGYRGHGLFICGECFSGGWQGGPDGGTVGYGYINTHYHGTLGDVKAGNTTFTFPNTMAYPMYGAPIRPMPSVPPVPSSTATPTPAVVPAPAPAPNP